MISATSLDLTQWTKNYLHAFWDLKPERLTEIFAEYILVENTVSFNGSGEETIEVQGRENAIEKYRETFFNNVKDIKVQNYTIESDASKSQSVAIYKVNEVWRGQNVTFTARDQLTFDSNGQIERLECVMNIAEQAKEKATQKAKPPFGW